MGERRLWTAVLKSPERSALFGKVIIFFLAALSASTAMAFSEKHYQEKWCAEQRGQAEVVLADNTRADCVVWGDRVLGRHH